MFDDFEDEEYFEEEGNDNAAPASSLAPPRENGEVLGHDAIEQSLLSLYNNGKLPHALIFAGPMGVGKTTMAFRVARFLLKHGSEDSSQGGLFGDAPEQPTNMHVSPDDPVAHKVASGGHPDLRTIERPMDERKGTRKNAVDVETARSIAPFLRMSASDGGWRVVIVDEADTMNYFAQNAILKILEEPPPKALLILICNRLGTMLPTIRSRCRTFNFAPLDKPTITSLLKRAVPSATSGEIALLTELSDGSMGRAMALQEEGGVNTLNSILDFMGGWPNWDWPKIHPWADNLSRDDKGYKSFAALLEWTASEILRAKAAPNRPLPEILRIEAVERLQNHYSLEQMIDICEKLKTHFITIDNSNLDKRQGVLGAFAILGGQTS